MRRRAGVGDVDRPRPLQGVVRPRWARSRSPHLALHVMIRDGILNAKVSGTGSSSRAEAAPSRRAIPPIVATLSNFLRHVSVSNGTRWAGFSRSPNMHQHPPAGHREGPCGRCFRRTYLWRLVHQPKYRSAPIERGDGPRRDRPQRRHPAISPLHPLGEEALRPRHAAEPRAVISCIGGGLRVGGAEGPLRPRNNSRRAPLVFVRAVGVVPATNSW